MNQLKTKSLAEWSNIIIKVLGLWLVLFAVYWASTSKLQTLRYERNNLPAGVIAIQDKMKQLDCLTKNIYWEAATEPFEGKVAVAQVTLNRVASGRFADSVCGVVYQKNVIYEKVICQFSWYCEGIHKTRAVSHTALWKESEEVAKKVLLENFRLPSMKNAMYYHADYVNPGWKLPRIDKIGRHIFYGERQ